MKKVNANEMRKVEGGLVGLVLGWTAVNVAIQGGAFALCYHFNKASKKRK